MKLPILPCAENYRMLV